MNRIMHIDVEMFQFWRCPWSFPNGPILDLVGQRPELLFNVFRRAAKIQWPADKALPELLNLDFPRRGTAVTLAIDQHAFGNAEGSRVGQNLVVVSFPAVAVGGDLVLGVGHVGDVARSSLEDQIGHDADALVDVELGCALRMHG